MADPLIIKEWLDKADSDVQFAKANLRDTDGFYDQICFHFQQAAEKYLKAYIICFGLSFSKVHDLTHLLRTCSAHDPALACLHESCILLNSAYIETRYPVHWPTNYTKESAEEAHAALVEISNAVLFRINFP
jgi:HEPN domain-containing protein